MNARILSYLSCILLVPASAGAAYGPPVIETEAEFLVYGDFQGDGTRSYLVIDRVSGGMRQARTLSGGGLLTGDPRATGVTDITGVAVGRFTVTDHDTIAVTSPVANRVRVCGPFGAPFDGWPSGVGPRHVTAVELPGGSAGRSDLVATTEINRPNPLTHSPYQQSFMLNQTLAFSNLLLRQPAEQPQAPLAVRLDDGEPELYAELRRNGTALDFFVYDTMDAAVPLLTQCSGITLGSRVVYGSFNPSYSRSVFVFHVPGGSKIQISVVDGLGSLTAPVAGLLADPADIVQPVEGGGGLWLAAISPGGETLSLYNFDSSNVPTVRQVISAPAGRRWSGVLPAAGGGWFAANSPEGGAATTSLRRFTFDGGNLPFRSAGDYDLEPLHADELGSDVLLFAGEPFLDPNPILRGRYRAGGWTSNLNDNPQFPSSMDGYFEVWRGAGPGLGNPTYRYLGIRPTGVTHGLSNQIAPDASFYSLDAPIGAMPDLITFDPREGPQTTGIEVTLSADDPTTTIYYATGTSTRWLEYSAAIGPISSDTTVRAYALNGGVKSPIQSAVYTFPSYPGDLDSDGDGVPDLVEEAHGLDPLASGQDSDLDRVSDLLEILAGTDPTNEADTPDVASIRAYTRHFDMVVEPLSHSGAPSGEELILLPSLDPGLGKIRSDIRTWVTVNRPDGTLELEKEARGDLLGKPPVKLTALNRIVADPPLFWVAGTPSRFNIQILEGQDPLRGRGVFRLLDYEAPDLYPLPRPELSGTASGQATQWVTAMRDHFSANAQVAVGGSASLFETVDLLLAEHALGMILFSRGQLHAPLLSLTPFRGDASSASGRHALNEEWLAELPSADHGDQGYDWRELLAYIRADGLPKGPMRAPLDELAREFYRIGYYAYDDPQRPMNLAPFDALRAFMDTRSVPAEYVDLVKTPAEILDGAVKYLEAFGDLLPERSYTSSPLTLEAGPGFFRDPWIVLDLVGTGAEYWLADAEGQPLRLPLGFRILPGFRFLVTGHPSVRSGGGTLLMIDSISLVDVPIPDVVDSDGNLLADSWEAFYFGMLGNDPFAELDGDRYQAVQEMFETTDPFYYPDFPAVAPVDLRPSQVELVHLGNMQFDLSWHWPAVYSDRVRLTVEGSSDLNTYLLLLDDVVPTSGDLYQTTVDGGGFDSYFFGIGLGLR